MTLGGLEVDEEKKVETRLQDLIEKFQVKIRTYKHQVEQAVRIPPPPLLDTRNPGAWGA